jgi:hypothetical protein
MQAANNMLNKAINNANTVGGSSQAKSYIIYSIGFVVVIYLLYQLYKFLYSSAGYQGSVDLTSGVVSLDKDSSFSTTTAENKAVSVTELSGILDGGEYTVSFWIYVGDTKGFASGLAHVLEISNDRFNATESGRGKTLIFVGINPANGSLIIRQSSSDPTEQINNAITTSSLSNLITTYNSGTANSSDDRCDILNGIEYQRWVLVTCVANGRTLDVYLDGKLARSCVYKANFALGSSAGKATAYVGLNNGGKLKGYLRSGRYYNYALSPDAIWALYQAGPAGYTNIIDFFKNLFSVDVTFSTSAAMNS